MTEIENNTPVEQVIPSENPRWDYEFTVRSRRAERNLISGIDFVSSRALKEVVDENASESHPYLLNIFAFLSNDPQLLTKEGRIKTLQKYGISKDNKLGLLSITPHYAREANTNIFKQVEDSVCVLVSLPLITSNSYNSHNDKTSLYKDTIDGASKSFSFLKEVLFSKEIAENEKVKQIFESPTLCDDIMDAVNHNMSKLVVVPVYDAGLDLIKYAQFEACCYLCFSKTNELLKLLEDNRNDKIDKASFNSFLDKDWLKEIIFGGKVNSKKKLDPIPSKNFLIETAGSNHGDLSTRFYFPGGTTIGAILDHIKNRSFDSFNWVIDYFIMLAINAYRLSGSVANNLNKKASKCISKDAPEFDSYKLTENDFNPPSAESETCYYQSCVDFVADSMTKMSKALNLKNCMNHRQNHETFSVFVGLRAISLDGLVGYSIDQDRLFRDSNENILQFLKEQIDTNKVVCPTKNVGIEGLANDLGCDKEILDQLIGIKSNRNLPDDWIRKLLNIGFVPIYVKNSREELTCMPAMYNPVTRSLYVHHILFENMLKSMGYDGDLSSNQPDIEHDLNMVNAKATHLYNSGNSVFKSLIQCMYAKNIDESANLSFEEKVKCMLIHPAVQVFFKVLKLIMDSCKEYDTLLDKFCVHVSSLVKFGKKYNIESNDLMVMQTQNNMTDRVSSELITIDLNSVSLDKALKKGKKDGQDDETFLISPTIFNDATAVMLSDKSDKSGNVSTIKEKSGVAGAKPKLEQAIIVDSINESEEAGDVYLDPEIIEAAKEKSKQSSLRVMVNSMLKDSMDFRIFYLMFYTKYLNINSLRETRAKMIRALQMIDSEIMLAETKYKTENDKLQVALTDSSGIEKQIDELSSELSKKLDEKFDMVMNQLNSICTMHFVKKLVLDIGNKKLLVYTNEVYVHDTRTGIDHNQGELLFEIPYDPNNPDYFKSQVTHSLKWFPASIQYPYGRHTPSLNNAYGPKAIVHNHGDGTACLGSAESLMRKAITSGNLGMLVSLMYNFAQSMNEKDTYGKRAHNWRMKQYSAEEFIKLFFLDKSISWKVADNPNHESSALFDGNMNVQRIIKEAWDSKTKADDIKNAVNRINASHPLIAETAKLAFVDKPIWGEGVVSYTTRSEEIQRLPNIKVPRGINKELRKTGLGDLQGVSKIKAALFKKDPEEFKYRIVLNPDGKSSIKSITDNVWREMNNMDVQCVQDLYFMDVLGEEKSEEDNKLSYDGLNLRIKNLTVYSSGDIDFVPVFFFASKDAANKHGVTDNDSFSNFLKENKKIIADRTRLFVAE